MMHSNFYQIKTEGSIPLFLISEQQWEEEGLKRKAMTKHNWLSYHQFTGKLGDCCLIANENGQPSEAYIGSGNNEEGLALAYAAELLPPGIYYPQQTLSKTAQVSWSLAQYCFCEYKKSSQLPRVLVVLEDELKPILLEAKVIFFVRDLINKPPNALKPCELAKAVALLAEEHQAHFQQWVGEELLHLNFPAVYTVGKAAEDAPRFLSLTWGNKEHPQVVLIGKGVCFDSGGLDLKPSAAMRLMKKDMGGAAHVMGLAQWIMSSKLPLHLELLIPAVENAIGPAAFRPGDVLTMRNGLTVEIDNTDGEGRLILADAMTKAGENAPELIIDFATLTGAARVAVGTEIAAMFSNHDEIAEAIVDAAIRTSDPIWRMPLYAGYKGMLDSKIANLANGSNSSYAGAITAALFLQHFIPAHIPWVHFDIMAWNIGNKPGKPEGGEAMAIRAVFHYLRERFQPS